MHTYRRRRRSCLFPPRVLFLPGALALCATHNLNPMSNASIMCGAKRFARATLESL